MRIEAEPNPDAYEVRLSIRAGGNLLKKNVHIESA